MAIETIKVGTAPNDGNGDPIRTAFQKMNGNFTNKEHSANRLVGLANGNVMEVGAFGLGSTTTSLVKNPNEAWTAPQFFNSPVSRVPSAWMVEDVFVGGIVVQRNAQPSALIVDNADNLYISRFNGRAWTGAYKFYSTRNTTRDSNGFLKAASPVVDLYADSIELNAEAELQDINLEVLGVGDYLITGSLGFAKEGWYVEQPKDANGNVLVAVVYEQLENNDISIKTFKKKFDLETASIVADLNNPTDIPDGRFISVRLQEIPLKEIDAPDDFEPQPTGLSQAVAQAMSGGLYDPFE